MATEKNSWPDLQATYRGRAVSIDPDGLIRHAFYERKHHKDMGIRTLKQWMQAAYALSFHGTMVKSTRHNGEERWEIRWLKKPNRVIYVKRKGGRWIACTMFDRTHAKQPPSVHARKLSKR